MSAVDTLRTAIFGYPPSADFKPSREGVLKAFVEMDIDTKAGIAAAALSGTDLDAAMLLVQPLVDIALDAQEAADASYQQFLDGLDNISGEVAEQLGTAVAAATAGAEGFSNDAELQADAAALSAAAASASATAAAGFLGGIMYPTTAAGVAAVADADAYFVVVGNGTDTYATLYQKVSGVAVKKADLPSRDAFDLPAASGGDDGPTINAIISLASAAGGGVVRGKNGAEYWTDETILLRSGVTLDLTGAKILNIMAIAERMISNPAMLAVGAACSISWTAGLEATVNQAAHGFAVGDYSWLRGAAQAQFRGVFRVVNVPNANSYKIQLVRTPSVTASGSITAVKADTDIALIGADLDYANVTAASGYRNCAVYFCGVANGRIERSKCINSRKMAFTIGAVNGFSMDVIHVPHTFSDLIKVYGPAFGVDIANVFGYSSDDFVSVHAREYPVFALDYQIDSGDVIGFNARNLNGRSENGKMFTMYATDSGPILDGIVVDGVHGGPSIASFGAVISAHCYAPEAKGVIKSFIARNITAIGNRVFDAINCRIDRAELALAGCRPIDPAAQFMLIDDVSIIKTMIVSGYAETADLTTARFIDIDGGRIDNLIVDGLICATPGNFVTNTKVGATLGRLTITKSTLGLAGKTLLSFTNAFAVAPKIVISDSVITALHVLESANSLSFDIDNSDITVSGYAAYALGTATVRISTRNARKTGGGWLNWAAGAKFEVFSRDISENISLSGIARVAGGFINNVSVGIGTITEAGIVDCINLAPNGWRVRGDPVNQRY